MARGLSDQVDTNFTRGAPYKIWEGKNVQNSARFLTTFDFDRKYLWNGSTYRKSEKYLINYISSPIGRKKFGELWSTNQKVIGLKILYMSAYNFGGSGPTLTKLYQGRWLEAQVIKLTLILQGMPLTKFRKTKKSEIQRDF